MPLRLRLTSNSLSLTGRPGGRPPHRPPPPPPGEDLLVTEAGAFLVNEQGERIALEAAHGQ